MHTLDTPPKGTRSAGTDITCACGATLLTLAPGEGVYPRGVLMRTLADSITKRRGECRECGVEYTIPVSRWDSL